MNTKKEHSGSLENQNIAQIIIHVMFAAYTVMWVEACHDLVSQINVDHALTPPISLDYRVALGAAVFFSLACLWWWYTNIFFRVHADGSARMSSLDMVLLAVFALGYRCWGGNTSLFAIILVAAVTLLLLRYILIIWKIGLPGGSRSGVAGSREYKVLCFGFVWLSSMMIYFFAVAAYAAHFRDGAVRPDSLENAITILVTLAVIGTVLSAQYLGYLRRKHS